MSDRLRITRASALVRAQLSDIDLAIADTETAGRFPESQKALYSVRAKWQAVLDALKE